jgi:hypothetical protein
MWRSLHQTTEISAVSFFVDYCSAQNSYAHEVDYKIPSEVRESPARHSPAVWLLGEVWRSTRSLQIDFAEALLKAASHWVFCALLPSVHQED